MSILNPTSLQFGPDARLYVSQQNGTIKAFTVSRVGSNNYKVTATEIISLINQIPNHNDDGTLAPTITTRQVTGILVTGTAAAPVLYVTSSDSRIGGPSGDLNLDTNSGIISKLTKTASGWTKVDLVRGLPRSEENHAPNGMQLDETTNTLYLTIGGITNAGSPSNNFAFTCEYALSAAILSVDLDVIEALPTQGSGNTAFKYDLPTVDDPTRSNSGGKDVNDPFGGNDGLNQAKIVSGGPVQVFAAGLRNAYNLLITKLPGKARRVYTVDNGANGGWGGYPANEGGGSATNDYVSGEPGSTRPGVSDPTVINRDNLHFIGNLDSYSPGSFYGGHSNPIRANPAGAGLYTHNGTTGVWRTSKSDPTNPLPADWPPLPTSMAHPIEGNAQNPYQADNALLIFGGSTNGLAEYTASNFNGAMKGDMLAANYKGFITRVRFNASGDAVLNAKAATTSGGVFAGTNLDPELASNFGATPLDIVAQGDNDVFPGTLWVCLYGGNSIVVFEPQDMLTCSGANNTSDEDGDGYKNNDEIANGTNPCSAGSKPKDNDKDLVSDLNDADDDNDGLSDKSDYFALDAQNGLATTLPIQYDLFNNYPGTGFFGLGFTGLMSNGTTDYLQQFTESNLIAGGAVGAFTVVDTDAGDCYQAVNSQRNAFQFGINVSQATGPFTVMGTMLAPLFDNQTPKDFQSQGIYIGTGDQDNYLKMTVNANGGAGGIELVSETAGVITSWQFPLNGLPSVSLDLYLSVDPVTGKVQLRYAKDRGNVTVLGAPISVSGSLLTAIQGSPALAVGIVCTSRGSASSFNASWDLISVTKDGPTTGHQVASFTLVNADTDQDIQTLSNGASLNLATLPTRNLNIRANTNPSLVGSVVFNLSGRQTRSVTESGAPYVLFGDYKGNYNAWVPAAGSYALKATPFSSAGAAGAAGTSLTINFSFIDQGTGTVNQAPVVSNPIPDQTATVGVAYGFAFATNTFADPEGQLLTYSASLSSNAVLPAWLSFNAATRIFSGTPPSGSASPLNIKVTASDGQLQASTTFSLAVNTTATGQQLVSFTLVNADTDQDIQTLSNGASLNLATLPTRNLNIRANTNPSLVGSVVFNLSGQQTRSVTEGGAPYVLFGDVNGNYNAWVPAVGSYALKATPFSAAGGSGAVGSALTVSFSVLNQPSTTAMPLYLINTGGPALTTGGRNWSADQYFDSGNANVKANVGEVTNTTDDVLYYSERYRGSNFNYNIPVPTVGTYTVKLHFAETYYVGATAGVGKRVFNVSLEGQPVLTNFDITAQAGAARTALVKTFTTQVSDGKLTLAFTPVVGDADIMAIEVYAGNGAGSARISAQEAAVSVEGRAPQLAVYPNPFSEHLTIEFTSLFTGKATLDISNVQGVLVGTLFEGDVQAGEKQQLKVEGPTWSKGVYIVRLVTGEGVVFRKLVLQ